MRNLLGIFKNVFMALSALCFAVPAFAQGEGAASTTNWVAAAAGIVEIRFKKSLRPVCAFISSLPAQVCRIPNSESRMKSGSEYQILFWILTSGFL